MNHWKRLSAMATAIAAPLLLSGCLLLPGAFNAKLSLLEGDRYEFAYTGQVQFVLPEDGPEKPDDTPFDPANVVCRDRVNSETGETTPDYNSYRADAMNDVMAEEVAVVEDGEPRIDIRTRPCTEAEIAEQRQRFDDQRERAERRYAEESKMVGMLFGGAIPGDPVSMRAFAERLAKYDGWNKVEYAGGNIFDVEYAAAGPIANYFAFPVLPDAQMQYPFFQVVRRGNGAVELLSPSFAGQDGLIGLMAMGGMSGGSAQPLDGIENIAGTITVETDGEVLSNNSADGFVERDGRKVMTWRVGNGVVLEEGPRVLLRLR